MKVMWNQHKHFLLKNKVLVTSIVVLFAVVLSLVIMYFSTKSKPKDSLDVLWSGNYTKERAFWKKEIDTVGAEKAYQDFKIDTQGKGFGIAHTLSHIMGELIYEKEGINGIVVCDASFAFGCYHSFFGRAITDGGIESVTTLDELCVKKFGPKGLGCPHGIGHGVLGYLGNDSLDKALEVCSKLSWKGLFNGCQSGVFMEYNFHTMQSIQGAQGRVFDSQKPLFPCDTVNKRFSQACYFELPAWHYATVSHDYAKTGLLCGLAPIGSMRDACFKGLGNTIAAGSKYNSEEAINQCELMPKHQDLLECRAGASWAFFAEPTTRNKMGVLCEGLSSVDKEYCNEQAKILI
ncbi:MAG: hypothetical protein RLZZ67_265 [Candidatus Parcubacteria bacterium]|jgi:hypothetical protein